MDYQVRTDMVLGQVYNIQSDVKGGKTFRVFSQLFCGQLEGISPLGDSQNPYEEKFPPTLPGGGGAIIRVGPWVSWRVYSPHGGKFHITDRPLRNMPSILHLPQGYSAEVEIPNWEGLNSANPCDLGINYGYANIGVLVETLGDGDSPSTFHWRSGWLPVGQAATMALGAMILPSYDNNALVRVRDYRTATFGYIKHMAVRLYWIPNQGVTFDRIFLAPMEGMLADAHWLHGRAMGVRIDSTDPTPLIYEIPLIPNPADSYAALAAVTDYDNATLQRNPFMNGDGRVWVMAEINGGQFAQSIGEHIIRL